MLSDIRKYVIEQTLESEGEGRQSNKKYFKPVTDKQQRCSKANTCIKHTLGIKHEQETQLV